MLQIENLTLHAPGSGEGTEPVLNAVSLHLEEGITVGLVGERGSGKLALILAILRLEPVDEGRIVFLGEELLAMSQRAFLTARRAIQPVFSPDFGALPPRHRLTQIFDTTLRAHFPGLTEAQRRHRIADAIHHSGLPFSSRTFQTADLGPLEIQQAVLTRALLAEPRVLLALDFTTGLDAAAQASLLNRLKDLQEQLRLGILFATPDLAVGSFMSDIVHILHRGKIVESAPPEALVNSPSHDYSQKLIAAAMTLH